MGQKERNFFFNDKNFSLGKKKENLPRYHIDGVGRKMNTLPRAQKALHWPFSRFLMAYLGIQLVNIYPFLGVTAFACWLLVTDIVV